GEHHHHHDWRNTMRTRTKEQTAPAALIAPAPSPSAAPVETAGPRLGELLVQLEYVSHTQLAEALLQQSATGKRIGALLVELGALDERDLARALAEHYRIELVDLRVVTPQPEALARLPESAARSLDAIALRFDESGLVVAVAQPSHEITTMLTTAAAPPVKLVVAPTNHNRRGIDQTYRERA